MILSSSLGFLNHFHGFSAYALIALLVIAESGIVVGFFIPGEIAVITGGVLAHAHHVNLPTMLIVANVASVAAFLIGYGVGTLIGPWLLEHRPLKGQRSVLRTQTLIQRWGGPAAFFGRFVAIVRAILPGVVGISDVPFRTFALFAVVGGVMWATLYTMLGYALGDGYQRVVNDVGGWALVIVGALVLALIARHVVMTRRHRASDAG
jgi:membrane-associated protein